MAKPQDGKNGQSAFSKRADCFDIYICEFGGDKLRATVERTQKESTCIYMSMVPN